MARSPYRSKRGDTQLPEKVRRIVQALPANQVGVYILKDDQGKILRVGHSQDLRHRIADYFRASAIDWPGTVESVEVIPTGSVELAQSLEKELIEEHQPPHNDYYNTATQRQQTETRRDQILLAAAKVFAQKGYQHATVKEIAAHAGIAPGTIYLYFDGKRDILSTIAAETETPVVAALLEAGKLGDRETIVAMVEKGLDITEAQLPFNRTLFSEVWVDDGILEESVAERVKQIHQLLRDYIAERIAAGVFRPVDPSLTAQLVMGMFAGLIIPAIRGIVPLPSPEKRHALAAAMVDLLLDGVRARDE